jgi:hypothetical protein
MVDIVEIITSRIGEEFDGECHLTEAEARQAAAEIAALRARCEKAEAELKYESDRGDEWFEKATYEVGGAPQLWSDRATAAESRCEAQDRRIAELEAALEPFAPIAGAILAEAPADSDNYILFMDCEGNAHRMTHDQLRAIRALIPEREG